MERRSIYRQAVEQAQNLAAEHDPSGTSFNVSPVVRLEDGRVITQESLRRKQEREAEKEALEKAKMEGVTLASTTTDQAIASSGQPEIPTVTTEGVHPERASKVQETIQKPPRRQISKRQQKKLELYAPRPPPPKPVIPDGINIPEGEQNWLDLWDLPDEEVERRVKREKRRKADERKALRIKQKTGKAERRLARDEKRKVYRDIKLEWKTIKRIHSAFQKSIPIFADHCAVEQTRLRTRLRAMEDEESKRVAVRINVEERQKALAFCETLGFTLENTPGVEEIQPKAQGMKGVEVDFSMIEKSEKFGDIQAKKRNPNRVDLGQAAPESMAKYVGGVSTEYQGEEEFIKFDVGDEQDAQILNYNHRLRRKLRRAIDNAEIAREMLVRENAIKSLEDQGREVPDVLKTAPKALNVKGHRILENGKLETPKQERVRSRVELTEFNVNMKVLRRQAKEAAIFAGLKKYAEVTGQIPVSAEAGESEPNTTENNTASLGLTKPGNDKKTSSSDTIGGSYTEQEVSGDREDAGSSETDSDSDTSMSSD